LPHADSFQDQATSVRQGKRPETVGPLTLARFKHDCAHAGGAHRERQRSAHGAAADYRDIVAFSQNY
jgi:hypothetical protein